LSDITRITGMASGLDVDALVKSMTKADTTKVDKAKQDKQIVQWKQDMYRDIICDLNTFKSTYFDVLKQDTDMLSTINYSSFDINYSDTSHSAVSVTASGSNVIEGTYNVVVNNIASGANTVSANSLGSGISYSSPLSALTITDDKLHVSYTNNDTPNSFDVDVTSAMTLSDLKDAVDTASSGKLNLSFSELTGKLTLKTTDMGTVVKDLTLSSVNGKNTLDLLHLSNTTSTTTNGANANLTINGQPVTDKSTNSFTIDGVNYKLSGETDTSGINFTVAENVDKTYDKIKAFVDKYNEIIDKISAKITEKKQYNYAPLTDDQKADMKDTEITAWEDKAKQGLLKGDSNLQNMLYNLRSSFYDGVTGAGISLSQIGLSTSSDVSQGGKIIIDETKLKDAIKSNGDQVAKLFMKTSETSYDPDLSNADRSTRNTQEGIFQRINDILQDNVRTIRDNNGKKGALLEKAGVQGDYTEYNNLLSNQLNDEDKVISTLTQKLSDDQDKYYNQFSKLEVAMQKLNQQSSWLTQQLGTSS
jgi:flagellar hook-associated protein 2